MSVTKGCVHSLEENFDFPFAENEDFRLYDAFMRLMRAHYKVVSGILSDIDFELHPAQFRCLLMLKKREGISQKELGELLHIERATVSVMLKKMEKANLVTRKTDSGDLRVIRIFLTDFGRECTQKVSKRFFLFLQESFTCIAQEEKDNLTGILNRIADNFLNIYENNSCMKGAVEE